MGLRRMGRHRGGATAALSWAQSLLVMCSRNGSAEGAARSRVWDTGHLHNKGVLQLLGGGQCGPRAEAS